MLQIVTLDWSAGRILGRLQRCYHWHLTVVHRVFGKESKTFKRCNAYNESNILNQDVEALAQNKTSLKYSTNLVRPSSPFPCSHSSPLLLAWLDVLCFVLLYLKYHYILSTFKYHTLSNCIPSPGLAPPCYAI